MKLAELQTVLETTGLPVTFRAWPIGNVPAMPYICTVPGRSDNFHADGIAFYKQMALTVELYTELYEEQTQELLEDVLTAAGLGWQKNTEYVETESFYVTYYDIEIEV